MRQQIPASVAKLRRRSDGFPALVRWLDDTDLVRLIGYPICGLVLQSHFALGDDQGSGEPQSVGGRSGFFRLWPPS